MHLSSFVEIKRFALAWGEHCRVVAPRSLVNEMKQTIQTLETLYRTPLRKHLEPAGLEHDSIDQRSHGDSRGRGASERGTQRTTHPNFNEARTALE